MFCRALRFFVLCLLFFLLAAAADEQFFDSNGVNLHYIVEGQGEPVVLLHGFTGNIERHWVASDILLTMHPERFLTATLGGGAGRLRDADDDRFSDEAAAALEQGKGLAPVI